ncbi:MAG: alanine--tRNA ligase [Thermoguttaceae bacterium]|jgi:alanyl-tRNA synthetase|nr:alanine--tRNA ligase [Thermoguttaceae bacterium]
MKTDELREAYLAFFESKGCVRRPSDVLVPRWDPSVLFTPAGMNQFKDHFLGRTKLEFTRATTCQKCLRTGDIDNVGRTAYHHTFFEMLGNFSFGDYFKREAILWAWEFCTSKDWLGLDPARLSATIYLDDDEAAGIWLDEVKLPREKLERLGEDENFWPANAPSQGPDGVCGPCSEIYYHTDRGSVEIWNLVFTQFNRVGNPPDNLRPLPSKNIDTGMGLERTAAVLQGVETNFHIDVLRPLVEAAGEVCGAAYDPAAETGRRLRRIADHVRACTFAIHENVYPGPNKEKYVIKRLLRRAVLDGRQMGVSEPFLHKLVGTVAELMKTPYPELGQTVDRVAHVIRLEETNFLGTIDGGLDRIGRVFEQMKSDGRGTVSGTDAAEMYTTYGFPPELFETLAAEHNLTFDWQGYQQEMQRHGKLSGTGEKIVFKHDPLDAIKKVRHGSQFLGYETTEVDGAEVVAIVAGNQLCDKADEINSKQPITLVLDKTPFYGEMGGQMGDTGEISGERFRFQVTGAHVDGAFTLHRGHLCEGTIRLGDRAAARIDAARRQGIRRAHSATHLLHHALRSVLGQHAEQQGSKVDDDWLRFDFTNPQAVSPDELAEIEREANAKILDGTPVIAQNMPLVEARKTGAMMLFGEKYPDVVRVVSMGDFSKELCGGTHLENTAQVGLLKIVSEESVAAGTRRIVALTGRKALDRIRQHERALHEAAVLLRTSPEEMPGRIEAMAKEIRDLKKKLAQGVAQAEGPSVEQLAQDACNVLDIRVVAAEVPGGGPEVLRQLIDQLRRKVAPVAALLASREKGKVTLIAGASREVVEKGFDCVAWVRAVAKHVGGGGGGRPDMAQAGGKNPDALPRALEAAPREAAKLLEAARACR